MMTQKNSNPKDLYASEQEKGQSLLEMALSMVILLILLAGIVDLGRVFFTYIALRDAAQEGAAFAAICPPDPDFPGNGEIISNRVKASSHFPVNMSSPNIIVNSSFPTSASPGSPVQVIVTYQNFQFIMPFLNLIDGNISARAEDVSLQYECPD